MDSDKSMRISHLRAFSLLRPKVQDCTFAPLKAHRLTGRAFTAASRAIRCAYEACSSRYLSTIAGGLLPHLETVHWATSQTRAKSDLVMPQLANKVVKLGVLFIVPAGRYVQFANYASFGGKNALN